MHIHVLEARFNEFFDSIYSRSQALVRRHPVCNAADDIVQEAANSFYRWLLRRAHKGEDILPADHIGLWYKILRQKASRCAKREIRRLSFEGQRLDNANSESGSGIREDLIRDPASPDWRGYPASPVTDYDAILKNFLDDCASRRGFKVIQALRVAAEERGIASITEYFLFVDAYLCGSSPEWEGKRVQLTARLAAIAGCSIAAIHTNCCRINKWYPGLKAGLRASVA